MKKRSLAMVLACVIATMCVAGCGQKKQGVAKGTFDENGVFVPGGDLSVNIWYTQGTDYVAGSKLSEDVVYDWVYDKTKVNIESVYGNDGGQWDTKLSRLIAGDNLPEVIACGFGQGVAHFKKLQSADKAWGISKEMLETYAPNVLKRVPEKLLEKFKIGDLYYGIPYYMTFIDETNSPLLPQEQVDVINFKIKRLPTDQQMQLYIRDDVLKKIYPEARSWEEIQADLDKYEYFGDELFDIPINTTEEFVEFMRKIKALNLKTESGDPVFAYGYSGGDNWEAFTYLGAKMMGYEPNTYVGTWNTKTQKIEFLANEDIVKQAAKHQNQLLNDGVFDPESLVQTTEMFTENVLKGQYAVAALNYAGGVETINPMLESQGASYRWRPFVVNIPTVDGYQATTTGKSYGFERALCFTKTLSEEGLIQMLNWMNVFFSDEYEEVYWWGPKEAGMYTEEADGTRRYVDERMNERFFDNITDAVADTDTRGVAVGDNANQGVWNCMPIKPAYSRWNPQILNNCAKLTDYQKMKVFSPDSKHTQLVLAPTGIVYNAIYTDIEETVELWSKREQWEAPIKTALAAKPGEFDKKWNEAMNTLNSIVDIDVMCDKMTKIAKAEYQRLLEEANE